MPLVTVVIPTLHHRHHSLQGAIESIADQTFQDLVVLVMPDGPDPRLADVLCNSPIPGVRRLWNQGKIELLPLGRTWHIYGAPQRLVAGFLCRTEFMAYLDDDNLWLPEHLELLLGAIGGRDFVYAAQHRSDGVIFDGEVRVGNIDTSSLLHRTDVLRLAQWPIDNIHIADGLFAERLVQAGATYTFVDQPTSIYTGSHGREVLLGT